MRFPPLSQREPTTTNYPDANSPAASEFPALGRAAGLLGSSASSIRAHRRGTDNGQNGPRNRSAKVAPAFGGDRSEASHRHRPTSLTPCARTTTPQDHSDRRDS